MTFFPIRYLLQNRPYFLKKWNWRKLANNIETKIITCTHFTQSEIVPQIVRNTTPTLTNNTTTTREQQNYNNKIITTTTGGPEEKIISSQKSSKVLTLSGGGNQNHHTTTQLVTTGEFFFKNPFFFCQTTACVYCVYYTLLCFMCVLVGFEYLHLSNYETIWRFGIKKLWLHAPIWYFVLLWFYASHI